VRRVALSGSYWAVSFGAPSHVFPASRFGGVHVRKGVRREGPYRAQNFYLVNIETGARRQLTNLARGPLLRDFDISPDGTHIVFDRIRENSDVVLIDLPAKVE
jgi:hypothetical protein